MFILTQIVYLLLFLSPLMASETSFSEPRPTNQELYATHHVGQVIEVLRSSSVNEIWPGFYLEDPALITFKNGHVIAFHLESQEKIWRKLSVNGQEAQWSEKDEWGVLQSPLNQSFPIENQKAYVFSFDMFENDPFLPFLVFVHERFHQHQAAKFAIESNSVDRRGYKDHLNVDNLALMKIEEALLVEFLEALKSKDRQVRIEILKCFVAINFERVKLLSPESIQWENLQQQMEGMADYVSVKLLDTHAIVRGFDGVSHLQTLLKNYLKDFRLIEGAIQWRHYGIGAVLGYALDDLGIKDWKTSVEQLGKGMTELLSERLSLTKQELQQLSALAKQKFDYSQVKNRIEKQMADYQSEVAFLQDKYHKEEGIEVTLHKPKNQTLSGGGNVGHTFQLSEGNSLSLQCHAVATVPEGNWRLTFKGIPMLFQSRSGNQTFKVERSMVLNIDGSDISIASIVEEQLEKQFHKVSWKGKHADFSSTGLTGTISGKNGKLSIVFH